MGCLGVKRFVFGVYVVTRFERLKVVNCKLMMNFLICWIFDLSVLNVVNVVDCGLL